MNDDDTPPPRPRWSPAEPATGAPFEWTPPAAAPPPVASAAPPAPYLPPYVPPVFVPPVFGPPVFGPPPPLPAPLSPLPEQPVYPAYATSQIAPAYPAPDPGPPPWGDLSAPRRRRRRGPVLLALLSVAALAGGVYVVVTNYGTANTPTAVVTAYYSALERADAAAALAYGAVPGGDRSLLTDATLQLQHGVAAIHDLQVGVVAQTATSATVPVTYQLGGDAVSDTVSLVKQKGTWALSAAAVSVSVGFSGAQNRALIAGRKVSGASYLMFPGALPITFDTPILQLRTADLPVRFTVPGQRSVNADVTAAGRATITAALRAALGACLAGTSKDALCPVPTSGGRAVPDTLRGTETGDPSALSVSVDDDGKVTIEATVHVTGTFQQLDFENQPVTKTGAQVFDVQASCTAAAPGRIVWAAP